MKRLSLLLLTASIMLAAFSCVKDKAQTGPVETPETPETSTDPEGLDRRLP